MHDTAADWVARCDAGLNDRETAEFESWLTADSRHRQAFDEYCAAWSTLDRPARNGRGDDVLQALQRLDRRQQRRRRSLLGTVAALVLCAAIPLWKNSLDQRPRIQSPVAGATKITVPLRQTLPDGSEIEMKDGAEVKVDFTAAVRRVTLHRGEAHFTVTKDADRPFVVEANGVEFRAVGTAFTVHSNPQVTELIVTEGEVAVEKRTKQQAVVTQTSQTEPEAPRTTLGVGERVIINRKTSAMEVKRLAREELAERLAWRAPRLEFSGAALAEVVSALNQHASRHERRRFVIDDPSVAQVRVSGLFRADNTAAFLDVLEEGFGIATEARGEAEIVLRRKAP